MFAIGYSTPTFRLRVVIIDGNTRQGAVDAFVQTRAEQDIDIPATILWVASDSWTGPGSGGVARIVKKVPPTPPSGWRVEEAGYEG